MREWPLPFLALLGTDIFLTRVSYGYPLSIDHAVTWIWYAAVMVLASGMLRNIQVPRALGASLIASVTFFLASNFAVWAEWNMYPKTWSGLVACYVAAVPFFRNSLVSELAFTALIFGLVRLAQTRMADQRVEGIYS